MPLPLPTADDIRAHTDHLDRLHPVPHAVGAFSNNGDSSFHDCDNHADAAALFRRLRPRYDRVIVRNVETGRVTDSFNVNTLPPMFARPPKRRIVNRVPILKAVTPAEKVTAFAKALDGQPYVWWDAGQPVDASGFMLHAAERRASQDWYIAPTPTFWGRFSARLRYWLSWL